MSTNYSSLIEPIRSALPELGALHALLGYDGTVDIICKPVKSRHGKGSQFIPFPKMGDFGQRVSEADGKSAMIEIVSEQEKIGGNGPIMANALAGSGLAVDYVGPLGQPKIQPAYAAFAEKVRVYSVAQPAVTHALEFPNGKLMLASISTYDSITAQHIESMLGESTVSELIRKSQLCCLLNWTCLPGLNSILEWHLETLLPKIGEDENRIFFFDLADPSMRSAEELIKVLRLISRFEAFGRVILGMNFNEAQQVCRSLKIDEPGSEHDSLKEALLKVREELGIDCAMSHPTDFAACATREGSWAVDGPHTGSPRITTGAGDHLNAGFCLAQLLKFSPEDALKLGVLFSGYYVRKAEPPSLEDILKFISDLNSNT